MLSSFPGTEEYKEILSHFMTVTQSDSPCLGCPEAFLRPAESRELLFIFLGRGDLLLLVVFFITMVVAGDAASGFSLLCSTSESSDSESTEFPDNTEREG